MTALFTATSAVCVTGLVVVDTATYWSPFGQLVILGLIQVGGFGFMTGSTLLLLLLVGRRTALTDRILAQESAGARDLGSVRLVLRRVAVFSIVAEGVGAVVLGVAFLFRYGDVAKAAWHGLFHSVSAFNNAGFDLMGGFASLNGFADDPPVFVPLGVLIFLGGLGVAIVGDVLGKRRWSRIALETKLVLSTTAVLLVAGTAALVAFEWSNPATLGALPVAQRPLNAAVRVRLVPDRRHEHDPDRRADRLIADQRDRADVHRRRVRVHGGRHQGHDLRDPAVHHHLDRPRPFLHRGLRAPRHAPRSSRGPCRSRCSRSRSSSRAPWL